MKKIKFHLHSIKNFSLKESILITFSMISKKMRISSPLYGLATKVAFDQLLLSGHKVTRVGELNKIELAPTVFDLPVNFYVRRKSTDVIIFNEILYHKEYKHLLELQQRINCDVRYIIDAGANIGSATVYMKSIFPNACVVSIEPEKGNYLMLKKNIDCNNFKNVTAFEGGLWNKDSWLQIKEGFRGTNKEKELSFYVEELTEDEKTADSIEGITVQGLMKKFSFPHIDILKIDIEGAERFLFDNLESTKNILKDVKILAIEVHEEVMNKYLLVDYLEKLNFKQITFGEILYAYRGI